MEMTALRSSYRALVPSRKPDLALLRFWEYELPDGIKHGLKLSIVSFTDLACLFHFLRQDLIDKRLIRQSLPLSGFT